MTYGVKKMMPFVLLELRGGKIDACPFNVGAIRLRPGALSNEALVRRALDEYPARVGMEKVSPVHLYHIETSNPLDAGISGFVVIAQSHTSLHAWPEYGEVDIDICSCKEFSQEEAIAFAREMFQTDDVEAHFVVRGNRSLRPETPDPVRYEAAIAERSARMAVR